MMTVSMRPAFSAWPATCATVAEVRVVAPDRDRSGASNSLTLVHPLRAQYLENGDIGVDGTPTDCVHLAITGLLEREPDLVISGINAGRTSVTTCCILGLSPRRWKGRFLGLPAIAVS
jgi:5'-nucleotidase